MSLQTSPPAHGNRTRLEPATFCRQAWNAIGPIRAAIDALPFLAGLRDGSLPRNTFNFYLAQDAHYLGDYSRALAMCASQADVAAEREFWTTSALEAATVECALHAARVEDFTTVEKSPTCTAYTSYLLSLTTAGSYAALAAAVLPCFWIYQDVGERLYGNAGNLDMHPYGDWIGTYAAPGFAEATSTARSIVDTVAARSSGDVVERMRRSFYRASQYEWMFWDTAFRREIWPIG